MNCLIPNYVVRGGKNKTTLINKMVSNKIISNNDSDKVLLVFKYLFDNTTNNNNINLSVEHLTVNSGFKPRAENYKKFRTILNYLHEKDYIKQDDVNFHNVNSKYFIQVKSNYFRTNLEGQKIDYFILTDDEIDKIYNIKNVDNGKLLLYYSTLKSRIYVPNHESDLSPQVCYATAEEMAKDIMLSEHTINIYNDILVDNGLVHIDNAGIFTKIENGVRLFRQSANTYTLTNIKEYKAEIESSINIYKNYMKDLGWKQCKEPTMTKRQVAGTINRLEQLEKEGKLTDKNRIKLEIAKNYNI